MRETNKYGIAQLDYFEAYCVAASECSKDWTDEQRVMFQLFMDRAAMNIGDFQLSLEKVLGRSVWTHELANRDAIVTEYLRLKPMPTSQEILSLIPGDLGKAIMEREDL